MGFEFNIILYDILRKETKPMPCECSNRNNSTIHEALCEAVNDVVTIYCDSACFTGLLSSVCCDAVKLITQTCPRSSCNNNRFGKVTIIPIDEVVAVTFCNSN